MLEFVFDILRFSLQTVVIVVGILVVLGFLFSLTQKNKDNGPLKVKSLNVKHEKQKQKIASLIHTKKQTKKLSKNQKKAKEDIKDRPKAFVINFEGDMKASGVDQLREEVTAVLSSITERDQVVAKIESPGGVVHGYGLAASQLQRITDKQIPLVACVDKVAASGGYMMASVADKIYSAPFAIVGSIGVVASLPNFNKILEKNDVTYLEVTAGEYKRTVTPLGKITDEGLKKFTHQIEDIHGLFKDHVAQRRPKMDIEKVATGEYWFGRQALELGLVDELKTSDDLLMDLAKTHQVIEVSSKANMGFKDKLSEALGQSAENIFTRLLTSIRQPPFQ